VSTVFEWSGAFVWHFHAKALLHIDSRYLPRYRRNVHGIAAAKIAGNLIGMSGGSNPDKRQLR
jgi:hypothetical protein